MPLADRDATHLPGHWLLARLGKKVLRPGGRELTERMLADAGVSGADVVELAPGLGRTAREIVARGPRSYLGVEADDDAVRLAQSAVGAAGTVVRGETSATGRSAATADVVVGEAMLTMQTDRHKREIVEEARRVLRPGGRYAIHELALTPDDLADDTKDEIRTALARSIKVNARPLTADEWRSLLDDNGFRVETVSFAPMALLRPRRLIADEGVRGTLRFVRNLLRDADARTRVLAMRRTFTTYRDHLTAIEVIARKA
ncbi:class I SAM-dependent methyltransferase [Prescottella subtropica]|uniref:class I SAM-dependent methyltransferase n=1 Tax=Prescottella subtropica TaxID=2545757 RepID=UPI0010FA4B94|nr:class I SAM-dependent methyltransferase [Prescottella subtropica]